MTRREFSFTGAGIAAAQAPPAKPAITSSVMLWTLKGSFEEKVEAAAKAGIQSVELVREFTAWTDAGIASIKKLMRSFKMGIDALSATPEWKSAPVSMVDPAQRAGLLQEVEKNLVAARKLDVPMVLLMSGDAIPGRSYEEQWKSLVEGTKRCADLAAKAGITLIVEPLNTKVNHKGYFLDSCVAGLKLIKEVNHPHARLLFDLYHEQVQVGDVVRSLQAAHEFVKVFHVADNPGRNDPGTGEMNYANIYQAIRKTGYQGYITMEYLPLGDQTASLMKAVDSMRKAL
ncbi:MAG: TIM barrel protein [Acidobacteria bacterium]|nr:TIM barrel protein [Acidobacteriota bacterium]